MPELQEEQTINVGISLATYRAFPSFDLKTWYAVGEFIDNALQSYLDNSEELKRVDNEYQLRIDVELDTDANILVIRDNAAGILDDDYARAFNTGEPPQNTQGLSEYGMGMKVSGFWFSPFWSVRTSALGEPKCKTIDFDVNAITTADDNELVYRQEFNDDYEDQSFTEIKLRNLYKPIRGNTVNKIKKHLASIYRNFIRDGVLILNWNGDELVYEGPEVLKAQEYNNQNQAIEGSAIETWEIKIDPFAFDINPATDEEIKAFGTVGIRARGSTSEAGLSLFRRGRVVCGTADEKYRPTEIFGANNSFPYQRIFGEIHFEGVDKTFTTDNIKWASNESEGKFVAHIKEQLINKRIIKQAKNYRKRASAATIERVATAVTNIVGEALKEAGADAITSVEALPNPAGAPPPLEDSPALIGQHTLDFDFEDEKWRVILEMTNDPAISDWLYVGNSEIDNDNRKQIKIRLSLAHEFMTRFGISENENRLNPIYRIAIATALAEEILRPVMPMAGTFRHKINALLETVFTSH